MSRKITIVLSVAILIGGFYGYKYIVNNKKEKKPLVSKSIPTVFTEVITNQTLPIKIEESGRLVAKRKALIYAEVQGVMEATNKLFKAGIRYKKGELLVKIRSNDAYAQLQAQKSVLQNLVTSVLPDIKIDYPEAFSSWNQYVSDFEIDKPIKKLPKINSDQEKYFITGKNIYTTYYNTKNLEIIQSKYNIRAPYDGVLTEALVNSGTVIRQGQQLGEFINPNVYELEVEVSQSIAQSLSTGKNVTVMAPFDNQTWNGKVSRINGKVDATTQTVTVFIELTGDGLKEGLYLTAQMEGQQVESAMEIDRKLLVEGEKLFVVKGETLNLVTVKLLHKTKNTAIVSGLPDGGQLVSKIVPGGYQGMQVKIASNKE